MAYLTSDLISAVKRRAAIPTSQTTFTNTDLLELGDEEIRSKLLPLIMKNMEEFYVRTSDQNITADQANYLIPSRAIASTLRDVQVVSSSDTQVRTPLERLSPDQLSGSMADGSGAFTRGGFYLEGNKVVLYPTPASTANYLRLSYYCRPNALVETTHCAQISSINTATRQITVTALPTEETFSTSTALDFVKAQPGFECSAIDQTPTDVTGTTFTFSASLPSDLAVGDYLCLAGESCVVQVPVELQPLLYQYVTVRVLASQGDAQALTAAIEELKVLEKNAEIMIAPRVDGRSKRVVNSKPISRFV